MSDTHSEAATLSLPPNPDLRHLKNQARDLHRSGTALTLTEAQFRIARQYGFASWPKLKAFIDSLGRAGELKALIDAEEFGALRRLMTRHPDLHTAKMGYADNGPLTWLAECRVPRVPPSETRLAIAAWMIENGSDVHQGGDGPLMRAALSDMRIPMMELLVRYGANVNAMWGGRYPIICAPCEALAPKALRWLLQHGAVPTMVSKDYGSPLAMVVSTYSRDAAGKSECLNVFAEEGISIPDTAPMALHRGRLDLLAEFMVREPDLLSRRFADAEIFPPEIGIKPGDGLTATSLDGATLLHMAIEFQDEAVAAWLLDHGADPNARSVIDAEGFGGQTPLYHTTVCMGPRLDMLARLLVSRGADPNVRATFRKQLGYMGDPEKEKMFEFHGVTPIGYARRYQEPMFVNEAAIALLTERGAAE